MLSELHMQLLEQKRVHGYMCYDYRIAQNFDFGKV